MSFYFNQNQNISGSIKRTESNEIKILLNNNLSKEKFEIVVDIDTWISIVHSTIKLADAKVFYDLQKLFI